MGHPASSIEQAVFARLPLGLCLTLYTFRCRRRRRRLVHARRDSDSQSGSAKVLSSSESEPPVCLRRRRRRRRLYETKCIHEPSLSRANNLNDRSLHPIRCDPFRSDPIRSSLSELLLEPTKSRPAAAMLRGLFSAKANKQRH